MAAMWTCDKDRECPRGAARGPDSPFWRWAAFLLLAGYLLFAHGCHGDEDNELFTWATRMISAECRVQSDECRVPSAE
jgi:hypothetical protein